MSTELFIVAGFSNVMTLILVRKVYITLSLMASLSNQYKVIGCIGTVRKLVTLQVQ